MKTDRLEDFIKANRDDFEMYEPSEQVWEKISKNGQKTKTIKGTTFFLKVAAMLAIAVLFTVIVVKTNVFNTENIASKTVDPEMKELIEAEAYYANQVNERMDKIRKCYTTNPEIKEEIETDLTELEQMYDVLKTDLQENISKKEVIEAMIENNRYRLKMVDDVLNQINC